MADNNGNEQRVNVAFWVSLGLGAGALLGVALARRAAQRTHVEIIESVEDLKSRTHRMLNDLSANVAELVDQTRATLQETVGPGAEES